MDLTLKVQHECSFYTKSEGEKANWYAIEEGKAEVPVDLTVRILETITGNKGNVIFLDEGQCVCILELGRGMT